MKLLYFGKRELKLDPPYLLQVQKEAWEKFLNFDLKKLLKECSPILDYTKERFELWFLDYRLGKPKYATDYEAKEANDTFFAPLYVKVKLVDKKNKKEIEQEVLLANLPLLTERCSFVINGIERCCIFQMIRAPGPYFVSEKIPGKNFFGAKIIPHRGAWLEFDTEYSGFISTKIDRRKKVLMTTFLRALGFEKDEEIVELFKDVNTGEIDFVKETLKRDHTKNQAEALIEIYQKLKPGGIVTFDIAKDYFENLFFNFERYDLSEVGRWRFVQRFGGEEKKEYLPEDRVLKKEDVISVLRELIRKNNDPYALPDQIDHLGNRRVRPFTEILLDRMRVGFARIERMVKDRMSTLPPESLTPMQLINPRPMMAVIEEFFTSGQISQFLDQENPLAEIEHKRRATAAGPGGLEKKRAGFEVRDVQPSHYGRICPIQTPEGQNVGINTYLAVYAKINPFGFLETPYFKVEKGKVIKDKVVYLNAFEEERAKIASGVVKLGKNGEILEETVEGRENGEPTLLKKEEIEYIDASDFQILSTSSSLIPFLQNDDANRALMGSNMQRQAVPLIDPDVPLIMTGMEKNVAQDSGRIILAPEDGEIKEVDGQRIVFVGKSGKKRVFELKRFERTNQFTCFDQRPRVKKGQKVKKGEPLTDGGAIKDGFLALGKNVLVAFLPHREGNFEDAIIASERLVRDDVFTSIYIENFECNVRETKIGPEVVTADIPGVSEKWLKNLDEEGIVREGAFVFPRDILVGKISPKGEKELSPEEKLLMEVFGEKMKDVKDTSLRMEYQKRGVVTRIKRFSRKLGHKLEPGVIEKIEVEVAELRKLEPGDKLAGRHGNKGVVAKILPIEEMPFLEDGTPVDLVLSPIGVISRMNLGQILETVFGFVAKKENFYGIFPPFCGMSIQEIFEKLKKEGFEKSLNYTGRFKLYDGKTGLPFSQDVLVGVMYIMKLNHMVADKIHARSVGPYSLITQQPLGGKARFGGQRFGEMEVWALEAFGAAHTLQEILTFKSDDVLGRNQVYQAILKGEEIKPPNIPASFSLLVSELKALGLAVEIKTDKKQK
jgi:DNA-directed RNA polymerase subunit beta